MANGDTYIWQLPKKVDVKLPIEDRIKGLEANQQHCIDRYDELLKYRSKERPFDERLAIVFMELAARYQTDIIELERIRADGIRAEASDRQVSTQNILTIAVAVGVGILTTFQTYIAVAALHVKS